MDVRNRFGWCGAALVAVVLVQAGGAARADDPAWTIPDISRLADDAAGRLIRQGAALIETTPALIGPEIADATKRVSGNSLACTSCHIRNGTMQYSLPLAGASGPVEEAVNQCLVTNLNGRPLPPEAPEMQAITAYIAFLGSAMPPEQANAGRGMRLPLPAGDADRGKRVFESICMVCHSRNGLGKRQGRIGDAKGYVVPPLWGKDSFTDVSPMMKFQRMANFIHDSMPDGVTWAEPMIPAEDAADAAAFVLSAPRPHRAAAP